MNKEEDLVVAGNTVWEYDWHVACDLCDPHLFLTETDEGMECGSCAIDNCVQCSPDGLRCYTCEDGWYAPDKLWATVANHETDEAGTLLWDSCQKCDDSCVACDMTASSCTACEAEGGMILWDN